MNDPAKIQARLVAAGIDGDELADALAQLQKLADKLSESMFPPERRRDIFEGLFEALTTPPTLEAACQALQEKLTPADLDWFRQTPEEEISKLHLTLGSWIRSRWCGSPKSRLSRWFNGIEIAHPEDMSSIVLRSFHRKLNDRPLDVDGQVRTFNADAGKGEFKLEMEQASTSDDLASKIEDLGGFITTK